MNDSAKDLHTRLQRAIDSVNRTSLKDDDEIFRRRALEISRRGLETADREVLQEVIVVRRGELLLAAPSVSTREVRAVTVVPVPGSTDVVNGIFQARGRTCGLIDLAPLLSDHSELSREAQTLVLIVTGARGDLGLRVDEVIGSRALYVDEIDTGFVPENKDIVSSVTRDLVHVIEVESLLSMHAIRVQPQSR